MLKVLFLSIKKCPCNSLATNGHILSQLTDTNIVRITNTQISTFEGILSKYNLPLNLFNIERQDSVLNYKFKADYFSFVISRSEASSYILRFKSISNKEEVTYSEDWSATLGRFDAWCKQIAQDIEIGKKIHSGNPDLPDQDIKIQKLLEMSEVLSPRFRKIFDQASRAQDDGYDELIGLGYRKAFEFLIKDYIIREKPDEAEKIRGLGVMQCINNYVTDDRLKLVAHRILWLGNDHAHYYRNFEDFTVDDLKELIYHTLKWIDLHEELLQITKQTEEYEKNIVKGGTRSNEN